MLKNMNIRKRLIVAFLIAIILSSLAGAVGLVLITKSDSDYSEVLENYGFAQGELGNVGRHFQASRVLNLYVVTAADEAARASYLQELAEEDALVDKYMGQVEARLGSELGQQVYATLSTEMQGFRAIREELFQTTAASDDMGANIALYRDQILDASNAVRETLDTMIEDKSRIGGEKSIELSTQMANYRLIVFAIIVGAFVCALLLAYYIARGISKPLIEIEQSAKKMAIGDYETNIEYISKDEVGSLADSMRQMMETTKGIIEDTSRGLNEIARGNFDIAPQAKYVGNFKGIEVAIVEIIADLSETMSQIKMSASQVASGSEQVATGAQLLAQGATEQASSVEELSASISEISEQIKVNASNAATASGAAESVGGTITTSNEQMSEMMSAMAEIKNSSAEIGKIIKTIEDIAFQTNILALNAAVEAARAGAAGKGFAVVADEVRNLATKSSEAAKQTNILIEDSVKSVEGGVKIAGETAESLAQVVKGAQEITDLINKISQASAEQSNAIFQINLGVEQISTVVQTNSSTSEESAAASEELNGQASMMKQMVSKFKLKSGVESSVVLKGMPDVSREQEDWSFDKSDKY